MAEFAYNNGYQESIKRTPFFANYGVNPEYQTIGHLMQGKTTPAEDMTSAKKSSCAPSLPAHPVRRTFQALIT